VRSTADGDIRAFERIYHRHARRIQVLFRHRCPPAEVEDLTQEVFIRAWQNLRTFRGEAALATWLHRIAANLAVDAARAARSRPMPAADAEACLLHLSSPAPSVVDRLGLSRAVDKLPHSTRRVFILHDLQGHSHQEIADLLQVPVGTSKARLHRARRVLRRELQLRRIRRYRGRSGMASYTIPSRTPQPRFVARSIDSAPSPHA
jgi:RNA polymerase sigma-70 factor (ECF subfamily)